MAILSVCRCVSAVVASAYAPNQDWLPARHRPKERPTWSQSSLSSMLKTSEMRRCVGSELHRNQCRLPQDRNNLVARLLTV